MKGKVVFPLMILAVAAMLVGSLMLFISNFIVEGYFVVGDFSIEVHLFCILLFALLLIIGALIFSFIGKNRRQKIVLWAGVVIAVIVGLFPPVDGYYPRHAFIYMILGFDAKVNYNILYFELLLISIIITSLICIFKDKKSRERKSN